ncbi:MAG: hypothetical protein IKG27_01775 [Bacilli bacterium]|nr:hypothetical protein [Bacilli bacterium]
MFFDNEEEIISTNEEIQEEVERSMAVGNYKTFDTSFLDTKEYERLLIEMTRSKKITEYNPKVAIISRNEIKKAGREFIAGITEGINTKISYINLDDDAIIYDFTRETGDYEIEDSNYLDFMRYALKKSRRIEITKLPVRFIISDSKNGIHSQFAHKYSEVNPNLLRKIPFLSCGIDLKNQNDELSFKTLVHEYTHALVDRHKGIIENYAYSELLSIFMELVAAYEKETDGRLIELAMIERLEWIRKDMLIANYNKITGYIPDIKSVYIDSTIYAMDLFEMYEKSSTNGKKAILNEIKKTLAGERTLEETLTALDASEERGSQTIRAKVKKYLN